MSIIYSIEKIGKLYDDFIFMVSDLFSSPIFGYFPLPCSSGSKFYV